MASWPEAEGADAKADRYLLRRLAAAAADYKGVAFTTFALAAGVGVMVWLACGVAAEHWIVPGGLSARLRWAWLGVGLAALAAAAVRWILPLLLYRVNLVYAARAIEQDNPELHNDIVNAVLVRARPEASTPRLVRTLERRAARRLSRVSADGVIDRTTAVRLAYALAALVAAACMYQLAAPKSLVVSAARLIAPWTGLRAPSRVRIEPPRLTWRTPGEEDAAADAGDRRRLAVTGGAATLVRGRQLVVSSGIEGLRSGERPAITVARLRDDGTVEPAVAGWRAEMSRAAGGGHVALLPDGSRGLDHSLEFTISAGDAVSEPVRVVVVDSPSLLVREVRYDYPDYTGLPDETTAWQGDLRAVEGTQATVIAECNQPLDSAWIDLDCDGRELRPMRIGASDLARATGGLVLNLRQDRGGPEHVSYRLVFQPKGASPSQREQIVTEKLEHRVDVVPDVRPEIAVEDPREPSLNVPPGAPLTIGLRAVDPDFGLAAVGIETRVRGAAVPPQQKSILRGTHRGVFRGTATIVPEQVGAAPGSVLEYRGFAIDTRPAEPNVTHTPWQSLRIDASAPPQKPAVPPGRPDPSREAGGGADNGGAPPESDDAGRGGGRSDEGKKSADAKRERGEDRGRDAGPPDASRSSDEQRAGEGRRDGGEQRGEDREGEQERSKRKAEPEKPAKEGEPQPGTEQGAADGSRSKQDGDGPAGRQDGAKRQQGARDGGGGEEGAEGGQGAGAKGDAAGGRTQAGGKSGGGDGASGARKPGESSDGAGSGGRQGQASKPANAADGKGNASGGNGDGTTGGGKGGKPAPKSSVAADGTNDGEAMERILEHRRTAQRDRSSEGQAGRPDKAAGAPQDSRDDAERGDRSTASSEGADRKDRATTPGSCSGADGKPCGKESCSTCRGGGSGSAGSSSGGGIGQGAQGQGAQGQGAQGQGAQGQGAQGQGAQGQGAQGQGAQGQGAQGQGAQGQGAQGQGAQGQGAQGQGAQGQGAQGQGAQGQGAQGQGAQGQGAQGQGAQGQGAQGLAGGEPRPGDGGAGAAARQGVGGRNGGPDAGVGTEVEGNQQANEIEWGQQDLAHARNAADLAMEHLRDSLAAGQHDVLDELGWTPEQARGFLERWDALRKLAGDGDRRRAAEFDHAVRSLGLRPEGVRAKRDVPSDVKGGQAEGRRGRPPGEYREQLKAYLQGTGVE